MRQQDVREAHDDLVARRRRRTRRSARASCRRPCTAPRRRSRRRARSACRRRPGPRCRGPDRSAPSEVARAGWLADRTVVGLERVERDEQRQEHRDRDDRPPGSRARRSRGDGAGTAGPPGARGSRARPPTIWRGDGRSATADIADPRVGDRVGEVRDDAGDDRERPDDQDDAHHQRRVAVAGRPDGELAEARAS